MANFTNKLSAAETNNREQLLDQWLVLRVSLGNAKAARQLGTSDTKLLYAAERIGREVPKLKGGRHGR